jgi:hypothetical protein
MKTECPLKPVSAFARVMPEDWKMTASEDSVVYERPDIRCHATMTPGELPVVTYTAKSPKS